MCIRDSVSTESKIQEFLEHECLPTDFFKTQQIHNMIWKIGIRKFLSQSMLLGWELGDKTVRERGFHRNFNDSLIGLWSNLAERCAPHEKWSHINFQDSWAIQRETWVRNASRERHQANLKKLSKFSYRLSLRLSLIHIWRCRRSTLCRSRWSPYH